MRRPRIVCLATSTSNVEIIPRLQSLGPELAEMETTRMLQLRMRIFYIERAVGAKEIPHEKATPRRIISWLRRCTCTER